MLTITVTEDLDLSKYEPEELVTARLQTPFTLNDDEAEAFNIELQKKAEKQLNDRLTDEQRQRRREYLAARARAEFEQYKQQVENMPDPEEFQAMINGLLDSNSARELGAKILDRSHLPPIFASEDNPPEIFVELPRPSGFTDEQMKALGVDFNQPKRKRKPSKTENQMATIVKIQKDQHRVLRANAEVMEHQLAELRSANSHLDTQLKDAKERAKNAEKSAKSDRNLAIASLVVAILAILVAVAIPVVQHVVSPDPAPAPIEQPQGGEPEQEQIEQPAS